MVKKVWIFGDSFTDSRYSNPKSKYNLTQSWIDIILSNNNIDFENRSISGQSNEGIYLTVIDSLKEISEEDFVFVSWSSNLRFLDLKNYNQYSFTTYLQSDHAHVDIWNKKIDMNTVIELNGKLSSNLKFSICASGLESVLKNKNINFKFIAGHNDFYNIDEKTDNLFPAASSRVIKGNLVDYFNIDNFLKLENGYCLVNEFFLTQLENINSEALNTLEKFLVKHRTKNEHIDKFTKFFISLTETTNSAIFIDPWHLNDYGSNIFAKKVENKILNCIL